MLDCYLHYVLKLEMLDMLQLRFGIKLERIEKLKDKKNKSSKNFVLLPSPFLGKTVIISECLFICS